MFFFEHQFGYCFVKGVWKSLNFLKYYRTTKSIVIERKKRFIIVSIFFFLMKSICLFSSFKLNVNKTIIYAYCPLYKFISGNIANDEVKLEAIFLFSLSQQSSSLPRGFCQALCWTKNDRLKYFILKWLAPFGCLFHWFFCVQVVHLSIGIRTHVRRQWLRSWSLRDQGASLIQAWLYKT